MQGNDFLVGAAHGVAPERSQPEEQQHHHAEEDPAVDQMVDAHSELHAAQVPDHHDEVSAHTVRGERHERG